MDTPARHSRSIRLVAAGALLVTLLWSVLLWDFGEHVGSIRDQNHGDLESVTEISAQALHFRLDLIDQLLLDLREHWASDRDGFVRRVRQGDARVADGHFAIEVVGRDGRRGFSSTSEIAVPADLADRPDFVALRDSGREDNLRIAGPLESGMPTKTMIQFARRLRDRDGGFDGIIAFGIEPDRFLHGIRAGHLSENVVLTVVRTGGAVIARGTVKAISASPTTPSSDAPASAPPKGRWPLTLLPGLPANGSGFVRVRDPVDSMERAVSWRRVGSYPLTLVVGEPAFLMDERIGELRRRYITAGALSSVLLVLAIYWMLITWRVRERTTDQQRAHLAALKKHAVELGASRQRLRELAAHQMALKEEERTRIAREIHDELGQRLTALRIDVSMLTRVARAGSTGLLEGEVAKLKSAIDAIMALVRDIAGRLRPPTLDVGLGAAIEGLVEEYSLHAGLTCTFDNRLPADLVLDDTLCTAAFRIVQESLTNVVRHAEAGAAQVMLAVDRNELLVRVQDDGRGIDRAAGRANPSFGLSGMQERAAMLGGSATVASGPAGGTTVEARIPLDNATEAPGRPPAPMEEGPNE